MKTQIRIYVLPLILSAALATVSGCATHGKPPPDITLDEPVAAHALPELPKPIEVVEVPKPLPLPEQLKPLASSPEDKPVAESPDEKVRVARANAEARVPPSREGYINAIQVWPYTDGALYQLYTSPGRITVITLQQGEELVTVSAGDTVRWIVGDTASGAGANLRVNILVKPTRIGLKTNLVITTNRRTYLLELSSTPHAWMASASWDYTPAQPGRIAQPGDAEDAARSSVFFRSSSATKAASATTAAAIQPEQASGNQAFNPMATASTQPTDPTAVQNRQDQKEAFLTNGGDTATRNPASLQLPRSPYQVMAGTIIPAALVTGINSDLPGQVIANVTEAVYDTATGRFLLIPQGSRLIGRYDSQVSFGQRRVLLVWTRLILPDTSSISLDRLPGIDPAGYAGLEDGVDWHWDRILAGAALSTLLGVGAELAAPNNNGSTGGVTVAVRQSAQDTVNQIGQEITKRNVSIQPTLTIRPGFPMRVMVNKDLILRPYQPLFFQRGSSQ